MSFRFILGRAGSGKTYYCLKAVTDELRRSPDGPPLILLVPEQATFQMDRALVSFPGVQGTIRAHVLSFRRLAWRVLAETGGTARPHIDEVGKVMALRALLARRRGELRVFDSCSARPGFLGRLARTLSELHAYNIRHPELEQGYTSLAALGRGETALAGKLHDLALISRDLEEYLAGRWVDPDDYLSLLAQKVTARPALLAGARLWVDGFAGFTPQELGVLAALLEVAAEVNVALCLDPAEAGRSRPPETLRDDPSTFHPTLRTYYTLLDLAGRAGVERAQPVLLEDRPRFRKAPALARLESEYPNPLPGPGAEADRSPGAVTLVAATSRQAEVAAAAREMVRLAREEGYRWREMSVATRSLDPYTGVLEATLSDYGIPYFIDRRRPVTYHPLVEFARSAVEVAQSNWAAEPVFRLLKTDLWPLSRGEVDLLENYVLAHGIRGRVWTDDKPWSWRRVFALDETAPPDPAQDERLALIDGIRRKVAGLLGPFVARLAAPATPPPTVRDRAAALWELIETAGVQATLAKWRDESLAAGLPGTAQEHEQVLAGLVNLLDQLVTNLGDQPITLGEFARILEAGLETLTLGLVPPSLDQVMVGAVDRSRQPDVRACFVLGVNDGVFPATSYDDAVFDDRERAELEDCGLDMAPASREKAFGEDYLAYIALTRPSEKLWVSYTLADDDGKAMAPSLVVSRLKAIFPGLEERRVGLEPEEPGALCAETETLAEVARVLAEAHRRERERRAARGGPGSAPAGPPVDRGWLEAYNWLVSEPGRRERTRAALRSLGYRNRPAPLPAPLAETLYGRPVRVSVSRLERYAGCPFSHFAAVGLALEPRPRQQLKAPQIGSYYHAVLSVFTRDLERDGVELAALDREALGARLDRAVAEVAPRLESDVLTSTARYRHLAKQLQRTVSRTIEVLQEHARRSAFRPVGPELRFTLSPGGGQVPIRLRGVIDRLEAAEVGRDLYLRVIDFKSGGRSYSVRETLIGLDIQLPAYLLAATRSGTEWEGRGPGPVGPAEGGPEESSSKGGDGAGRAGTGSTGRLIPAGAFFFPVADPYVRARAPLDDEELARKRLDKVRVRGFILNDPAVLELMDRTQTGEAPPAPILPFTLTKSGAPRKGSSLLEPERMRLLLEFTWTKLARLTAAMREGRIDIRPVRRPGGESVCRFCDFRPLCRFDLGAGDEPHRLPRLTDDDAWVEIAREVDARGRGPDAPDA